MDWTVVGQAIAWVAVAAARVLRGGAATSRGLRRDIGLNVDLSERLPDDSEGRAKLLSHIDQQVERLIAEGQTEKRADGAAVMWSLIFIAGGVVIAYRIVAVDWSGGWWISVVALVVVGFVMLVQNAVPRERDERGRLVRKR